MSRSAVLAVVAVVAVVLGWWLWPGDAARVRRICHELAETVSVPSDEQDLGRVARAARLSKLLTDDVVARFEGEAFQLDGRDQVLGLVARLRPPRGLTVTFDAIDVLVADDGMSATATTTATAREPDANGGPDTVDVRAVTLTFRKTDAWQLADALVRDAGLPR